MKKIIPFLLILIVITSCYNENKADPIVPAPFIAEDTLINILTDIQLAEAVITFSKQRKIANKQSLNDSVYNVILEHYNLTAEQLNANLNYYNHDPKNMQRIYDEVLSNLSTMQSEIQVKAATKDTTLNE